MPSTPPSLDAPATDSGPAAVESAPSSSPAPSAPMRGRAAQTLLVAASVVIVIAGLKSAASLILPFLGALFLALINLPLLNWLRGKRFPMPLAVLVTLFTALACLAGIVFVLTTSFRRFTAAVPRYQAEINAMFADLLVWLQSFGLDLADQVTPELIDPAAAFDVAQGAVALVVAVASNFLMVLLIIALVLFEAAGFPDKINAAFGSAASSERYEKIREEIQRYLGIKTLISLVTGSLVMVVLTLLGIEFALLWATLAFLLNYIPTLGSIIAAVPPVLLAGVQHGPGHALAVAAIFVVINVSLGNLLEPYLMGRRFGLSTLVVFLSLVFWGWVWGPLGMLLSVPLTMILKIMLEHTDDMQWLAVLLGPSERPKA